MKAITLHQPWATLVAIGAKRIETRSWRVRYTGPLAIAAGRNREHLDLCAEEPFRSVLRAAGIFGPADLPFGVVLCVRQLVKCVATEVVTGCVQPFTEQERAFGNYADGRFAWLLDGAGQIERPVPARGYQGIWEWKETTG